MKHPDKLTSRALRMERAIRQLEFARRNLEAACRTGEFGSDGPLIAIERALDSADAALLQMRQAIKAEADKD